MRGIGRALAPFSAAPFSAVRALIAGAAILAGATAPKAHAQTLSAPQGEETALAIPRPVLQRGAGVALPEPLPPSEAARIRHVFALQQAGDLRGADREAALLDAELTVGDITLGSDLRGYILADRHLGPFTRPAATELEQWLARWPDLTDAPAVHALLRSRLPRGAAAPPAPASVMLSADVRPDLPPVPVPEETEQSGQMPARSSALDRSVWDAARSGRPEAVRRLLAHTKGLSPTYAALLRGEAAQILFVQNRDSEALAIGADAVAACTRAGADCHGAALAGYAAGLAAWRLERPDLAGPMFEAGWRADLTTSVLRAATAFWAARVHLRTGKPAEYMPWMLRAADEQRTFYGLLARRTLGLDIGFAPGGRQAREILGEADIEAIAATPQGLRAFALLQVGQGARAEAELRRLWPAARTAPGLGRAIMLVARQAGLVELAAQLADLLQAADGRLREDMRFAVPRLRPSRGFRVDPALVYGIARTESDFNPALVSSAGALGLMQIMPETASFITRASADGLRGRLTDPGFNLDLGQRYITYLAGTDPVDGNLLRLLASYNAGPGSVARWAPAIHDAGDPLLFIEAIPIPETRAYVARVLAYTWTYAARLHLPTPTLDELAAGGWPRYHAAELTQEPPARLH